MQGISIPLIGIHVPSAVPLYLPSFFAITWWNFHSTISPWTILASVNSMRTNQRRKVIFNNFPSLIGFHRVNWNDMLTLLVLWFSETLKFFNYRIFITTAMTIIIGNLIFANHRQAIFAFMVFKCAFEDTFYNYGVVSFRITKIILCATKFCEFLRNYIRTRRMFFLICKS